MTMNLAQIQKKLISLQEEVEILQKENTKWTKFTFLGKELEISEYLGEMDWHDGVERCKELGGILPPRFLLTAIYDEKELEEIKKTFSTGYHWSSTELSETYVRYVNFSDGYTNNYNKTFNLSVRCVRGLSQHSTDVMQPFQLLDDSDKNKAPLN